MTRSFPNHHYFPQPDPGAADPSRLRLDELLIARATIGLDASENAELQLLGERLGIDAERAGTALELAAAAGVSAMVRPAQLPASLRAKLIQQGQRAAALHAGHASLGGVDADERRQLRLTEPERGLRTPTGAQRMTQRVLSSSGWLAAAACLALACTFYFQKPVALPPAMNAAALIPAGPVEKTLAHIEKLLSDPTRTPVVVQLAMATGADREGPPEPIGHVVWDQHQGEGVLHLTSLSPLQRPGETYQLWVTDAMRDRRYPVDAGTFRVPAGGTGELIVPVTTKLPVSYASAFSITIERAGGNVVSDQEPIALGEPDLTEPPGGLPDEPAFPDTRPMR